MNTAETPKQKERKRIMQKYSLLRGAAFTPLAIVVTYSIFYMCSLPFKTFSFEYKNFVRDNKYRTTVVEKYYDKCKTLRNLEQVFKHISKENPEHSSTLKKVIEVVKEDSIRLVKKDEVQEYLYQVKESKEKEDEEIKRIDKRLDQILGGMIGTIIFSASAFFINKKRRKRLAELEKKYPSK